MADVLYDTGRNAFLTGDIDWVNDDIRAILVDTADYTVNAATDEFLDDVPAGAREEISALTGKTAVDGVADADDVAFSATSGDDCEAIVLYKHTGSDATSQLIAYIDQAAGLPVTLGGDVTVRWDDGANKIFKL
jgi:hypothetical protein